MYDITEFLILTLVATAPPIILLLHVYRSDKQEKEPWPLLGLLLLWGAASLAGAAAAERAGLWVIGRCTVPNSLGFWTAVCFLLVGPSEELAKFLALKLVSWRRPAFNYRFDAIVYSVFTAMGFALAENLLYAFAGAGLSAALGRGLTAIPGHGAFSVFMGYYYGTAKQYDLAASWAEDPGDIRRYRRRRRRNLQKAVLVPAALHGCYDLCLHVEDWSATVVFTALILVLDIVAIYQVRRASQWDGPI